MDEPKIVNLTLEFTLQIPSNQAELVDIIAETMMKGAVNALDRNVSGTGYNYDYTHKKSKRGLIIKRN